MHPAVTQSNPLGTKPPCLTPSSLGVGYLGALVLAAEALSGPNREIARRRFQRAGDRAFSENQAQSGKVVVT